MKRYALFAGSRYYPRGGWEDFRGTYDTPEEAAQNGDGHDWWHTVDLEDGQVQDIGWND